jgi:uncharacterized surface protein with fasciclin (FAS1) repeats
MKKIMWRFLTISSALIVSSVFFLGCQEDPQLWNKRSQEQVISEFVETNADYSQFKDLLLSSGLNSFLAVRGPFTLFLPTNEAMTQYYTAKGTSLTSMSLEAQKELVLNHLVPFKIETGDVMLGALRNTNAIGDYLVTEFSGADIIVNKTSMITKRNIQAANGVIHQVNHVIEPVSKSVYQVLSEKPSFSLFTKGLEVTGLKDTLSLIEFPFGTKKARTRYTILAVADTTFNRFGITTIDQLIDHFNGDRSNLTSTSNSFYRYMEYHCLAETYYLNNFNTRVYPVISYDNNISVTVDTDYKLNYNALNKTYTGFIIEESNYPAKNGAIHTIRDLLPVFEPRPTLITWETTDHFDMKQGDYFGKHYARWFDGQNTFKNVKWEGDYMLYYFKDHNTGKLMNHDCLSMSGWWWVEVTTPKIMKGKYRITSNLWSGQIDYAVYIDGVNTAMIKRSDPAESTTWAEVNWTETKQHTIKVVATSAGLLFWDTVIFTPID